MDDGPKGMVSFNHYAYGAAASWMYTRMCGLKMTKPGYKEFKLAPMPGGGITWASISRKTAYGEIKSCWNIEGDIFKITFTVPEQTKAIIVGFDGSESVYEPGNYAVEWKMSINSKMQ